MTVRIEVIRCKKTITINSDISAWLKEHGYDGRDTINLSNNAEDLLAHLEKFNGKNKEALVNLVKSFIEDNKKARFGSYELVLRLK